jgi:hypothetical protein
MQVTFCQKHYDKTMEALRVIVFDNSSSPSLFLRAKCLECIGTLVRNFEQDKFNEHEVFVVSISANSYLNFKLVSCFKLTNINIPTIVSV